MRTNHIFSLIVAGLVTGSVWASPQEPNGELDKQLRATFVPTRLAADRVKVIQAGTVLTVQKDGIGAISPAAGMGRLSGSDQAFYPNIYKSGTVRHDALRGMFLEKLGSIRDLAVNEQVYLLKLEYKGSSVILDVQTCGTCDPKLVDPENVPARAAVAFQFPKGFLDTATPVQVQTVISHVFAPPAADASGANASPSSGVSPLPSVPPPPTPDPAPVTPSVVMAPIAPPPPPADAPTSHVEIGQTVDQVIAEMGQPLNKLNGAGGKQIFMYKGLKITFLKGKVSDVE